MLELCSGSSYGVVSPDSGWDEVMEERLKNDPLSIADNKAILAEGAPKKHVERQLKITQTLVGELESIPIQVVNALEDM